MNTIKTLLLGLLMTFSCQASTFTRIPSKEIKPLYEQIQRFINGAPEIKIYDEIIVMVKFRLNTHNKIVFISDDSNNYRITKFIKTNLNLKEVAIENNNNNRVYSIPFRFKSTVV